MASVSTVKDKKKFDKTKKNTQNICESARACVGKGKVMETTKIKNAKKILCGVAVGAANSLFGGGGGMLAVPLLNKTGYDEKTAHATAILVILPVSLFSFLLYLFRGFVDYSVLIPTSLGVTAGGFLGARLLGKMPTKTVNLLFALLQALAGAFLFFS